MCDWRRAALPLPTFDPSSLHRVSRALADDLTRTLRSGAFAILRPPAWANPRPAIDSVFRTDLAHHLFRADPIAWVQLTETQITGGFVRFLNAPGKLGRLARTRALLTALGVRLHDGVQTFEVRDEVQTRTRKRIDILVEWKDSSGIRCAAAIEAKVGDNGVSPGSLHAYRNHLERLGYTRQRRQLIFVSPRLHKKSHRALQRNREWRWVSWQDLFLTYDRALDGTHDDEEFRQFRRTAWNRAG